MIDWDSLVQKPVMQAIGEPGKYTMTSLAQPVTFDISVLFDDGFVGVDAGGGMRLTTAKPVIGIRLAEFPTGFEPETAQGDTFKLTRTGVTYEVKEGQRDSKGGAVLHLNRTVG